jgi:predicted TIM-barrel fold metal-dependent hydrolase
VKVNYVVENKIIDIHAHVFPDKIAHKAATSTGNYYGISMHGNGTVSGLIESGSKIGVGKYIIHSTATKADQVVSVNDFIASVQATDDRFIGFGTLHPDFEDIGEEVDRIISLGFKGIKLHPDFQRFNIDGENMIPIYRAIEGRLPLLMHMGDEEKTFSHPRRLARVLDIFPSLTVIAAHMGGYMRWEESMEFLVGRDLYFDTSSTLAFMDSSEVVEMIRAHGSEKVLFGVDYPMWTHEEELERIYSLGLCEQELELILWKNASRILNI